MPTSPNHHEAFAQSVRFSKHSMTVSLDDGRTLSVPLTWYPRLLHGTKEARENFELIGDGEGMHWPDLDEDVSVQGLLAGMQSAESARSLASWLEKNLSGKKKGRRSSRTPSK